MIGRSILTSAFDPSLPFPHSDLREGSAEIESFTCESSSQVDRFFGAQHMTGREEIFSVNAEVVADRTIAIE